MNTQIVQVVSATETGDCKLSVVFDDGVTQEIDFRPFLSAALHPDLRAYLDPQRFSSFRVEHGDLVWGDYDLCFPIMDLYKNQLQNKLSFSQAA
jgi:hypothetical protein